VIRIPARCLLGPVVAIALAVTGCGGRAESVERTVILNRGSDTMINVAQAWAEAYATVAPNVSIEVAGGGSGVGIAALIDGTVEMANSSRPIRPEESEQARARHGVAPVEFITGYDALAVYVHRDNPVAQLTLDELHAIYAEDGRARRWSDLGVSNTSCRRDTIIRISRQSSSGTYDFFRERALAKHDFALGTLELSGSKEVVELVSHTPCAIGYSGMGYATPAVRMVPIARDARSPAVAPSPVAALDQSYPIARPLYVFTSGEPHGETKRYIDWILSDAGQQIVAAVGYVPLRLQAGGQ
jgi:phosphate transport system substrate-binding protein